MGPKPQIIKETKTTLKIIVMGPKPQIIKETKTTVVYPSTGTKVTYTSVKKENVTVQKKNNSKNGSK